MAAKINTRFVLILFIVGATVVGVVGGLWFLKARTDVTRSLQQAEEFMAQGEYRKARTAYSRAVAKDPANVQYLEKLEEATLNIQPDTAIEAREMYIGYVNVLRHAAVHHPTDPAKHRRLLEELHMAGRRSQSPSYTQLLAEASDTMWNQVPAANPDRSYAKLYRGLARIAPWMHDRMTEEEIAEGEADLEAFLEANPGSDVGWAALIDARYRQGVRARDAGQITRAGEVFEKMRDAAAKARQNVTDGPETLLALLNIAIYDHEQDPASIDIDAVTAETVKLTRIAEERDDPYLIIQSALMLERLFWLGDRPSSTELLDKALARHPDGQDFRLLKARLQFARAELDEAQATSQMIVDSDLMKVGFLSQLQFELQKQALSLQVDVAVRRWDLADVDERPNHLKGIEDAVAALEASLTDTENDRRMLRARGQLAFCRQEHAKAASIFNRLLASGETDYQTLLYAALSFEAQGELGAAVELVSKAAEDNPGATSVLIYEARMRERLGQYEEALIVLDKVLAINPRHEEAGTLRQIIAQRLDPSAIQVSDPARIAIQQAAEAFQEGDHDLARATLLGALEQAPNDLSLINGMVRVEVSAGRTESAMEYVHRGLAIAPKSRTFLTYQAHLENPDRIEAITQYIETVYADDPVRQAVELLLTLRSLGYQSGQQAEQAEADGDTEGAAELRDQEQRARAAEGLYDSKVAQLAPQDPRYLEYRFIRAVIAKDWDEAEEVVGLAADLDTDQAGGALYRGRLAAGRDDAVTAVRYFEEATEKIPYSANAWRLLAISHRQLGNFPEALAAFEQSHAKNPNDMTTVLEYASMLTRSGNDTRALAVLRRGRRLDPTNDRLRELWLVLEAEAGDPAVALAERRRMYEELPTQLRNAGALASLLGKTEPIREMLLDDEGEERYSIERWNRLPARGANSQQVILAAERQAWYAEADEIIESMLAEEDRDLGWHMLKAELLRARGDHPGGEAVLDSFAATRTDDSERLQGLLALGIYQGDTGREDQAIATFEEARQFQAEGNNSADIALAELLFRVNRDSEAAPIFARIVVADRSRRVGLMYAECLLRLQRLDDAAAQLDRIDAESDPDTTGLMLRGAIVLAQASTLAERGRPEDAASRYDEHDRIMAEAEALDPQNPLPHVMRAEARVQRFRQTNEAVLLDDALMMLGRADEVRLGHERTSLARVRVLRAKNNVRGAINELKRLLERKPDEDRARQLLVQLLFAEKQFTVAVEIVEDAVQRNPGSTVWRAALGDLYMSLETEARNEFATMHSGSREARERQATAQRMRQQATEQYAIALRMNNTPPLLLKYAQVLLGNRPPQIKETIDLLESNADALDGSAPLRITYAQALAADGRGDAAKENMAIAYAKYTSDIEAGRYPPDAIRVWYAAIAGVFGRDDAAASEFAMQLADGKPNSYELAAMATTWRLRGQDGLSRAIELFRQAAAIAPAEDETHRIRVLSDLGVVLLLDSQYDQSLAAFEKVLAIDSEKPEVLNNVAYLLANSLHDPERALPFAEKAAELEPDSSSILDTLGWIYFQLKQYDLAESSLRRSAQIEPSSHNQLHLAAVFHHQGNNTLATRFLSRAAELEPDAQTMAEINRLADDIRTGGGTRE
jgi:tetratricopeptide (TPR) repeat protein